MTVAAQSQGLLLQLLDQSNRADPYPVYRKFLEAGPLQFPDGNVHVFPGFADCDEILRHPASCSDRLKSTIAQREIAAGAQARPFGPPGFLFLDPPHLRRPLSGPERPRVIPHGASRWISS